LIEELLYNKSILKAREVKMALELLIDLSKDLADLSNKTDRIIMALEDEVLQSKKDKFIKTTIDSLRTQIKILKEDFEHEIKAREEAIAAVGWLADAELAKAEAKAEAEPLRT
jgi:hypothetical protein